MGLVDNITSSVKAWLKKLIFQIIGLKIDYLNTFRF